MLLAQRTAVHLYGDMMVWYHMFVIFVMYCMLPVPVKGRQTRQDIMAPSFLIKKFKFPPEIAQDQKNSRLVFDQVIYGSPSDTIHGWSVNSIGQVILFLVKN